MSISHRQQASACRILDANVNRALEGLRVCEDIVRFHILSPVLFRRVRALRHGIAAAARRVPGYPCAVLQGRASAKDPGRRAPAAPVTSLERLLLVNFQRSKEALRTLEECSRLMAPRQTAAFQRLRFRTYEVERALVLRVASVRHH